jgi:hypothetical protein
VSYLEEARAADEASGPLLERERWVLRFGAAPTRTRFAPISLDSVEDVVVSWVMRVERARWNDDAVFEVRARSERGEERVLSHWGADELRRANPGSGNFQVVTLPADFRRVELIVEARASVERGAAWFDFFALRIDGTNRSKRPSGLPQWERPPYLQKVGRDRATLRWRSRYPSVAVLRWWPDAEGRAAAQEWRSRARATEHEAELGGLRADTHYRYEIDLDGTAMSRSSDYRFRTAPTSESETPIGIWVIGDSGRCGAVAVGCALARRVSDAFDGASGDEPPQLWLLLGDNAYTNGTDWQYTEALFSLYARRTATTPLWPVLGNHDLKAAGVAPERGAYFESFSLPSAGETGGVPSGREAYYSFDWGPIHFVALDSTQSARDPAGEMASWLEADLAAAHRARWRIAFFHHPPYTRGSHDSDDAEDSDGSMVEMREVFAPILERHGVDLVLGGHSHGYERSALIYGHYGPASSYRAAAHRLGRADGSSDAPFAKRRGPGVAGTVYAVVGSSSQVAKQMRSHPVMVRSLPRLGSLWLVVEGFSLRGRFIDDEGGVLDDFFIRKPAGVESHPRVNRGVQPAVRVGVALLAVSALAALLWSRRQS